MQFSIGTRVRLPVISLVQMGSNSARSSGSVTSAAHGCGGKMVTKARSFGTGSNCEQAHPSLMPLPRPERTHRIVG